MRFLRLFSALLLSTLAITGCHHKQERVAPPPQAQAPIVTTLPPIPPLTFPDVQLNKPKPAAPAVHPVVTPPAPEPHKPRIRHRHAAHKIEPDDAAVSTPATAASSATTPANTPEMEVPATKPTTGAAALGQLSADDAASGPHQNVQTEQLIKDTEDRLSKIPNVQQTTQKEAIAQVSSFLKQAKQALGMNDVVGAQTLANKAKILLDELLK